VTSNSRVLSGGLFVIGTLSSMAVLAQGGPSGLHTPAGIMWMRGAGPPGAVAINPFVTPPANPNYIPYNGGKVIPYPRVYAFWWGNPSDFPPDTRDGIVDFFHIVNGTPYLNLLNQYLFGKEAYVHFAGNVFDYSAPPAQDPPTSEVVAEVYNVLTANGLKPDPTAFYAVYTSNFPPQNYYCAFHDIGTAPDGTVVHVMFIPNAENLPACWVQPPELSCNAHSNGLQAGVNSTAHELFETITDPNIDAWVNLSPSNLYNEIGDPCNFVYKHCVGLADGSKWQIQEIWSDRAEACRQTADE
jgi:hypothetical protein